MDRTTTPKDEAIVRAIRVINDQHVLADALINRSKRIKLYFIPVYYCALGALAKDCNISDDYLMDVSYGGYQYDLYPQLRKCFPLEDIDFEDIRLANDRTHKTKRKNAVNKVLWSFLTPNAKLANPYLEPV